jgi:hypothetical protein
VDPIPYLITTSPITGNPLCYYVTEQTVRTILKHRDAEEALRRYGQLVATGSRTKDGQIEWVHPRNGTTPTAIMDGIRNAWGAVAFFSQYSEAQ